MHPTYAFSVGPIGLEESDIPQKSPANDICFLHMMILPLKIGANPHETKPMKRDQRHKWRRTTRESIQSLSQSPRTLHQIPLHQLCCSVWMHALNKIT